MNESVKFILFIVITFFTAVLCPVVGLTEIQTIAFVIFAAKTASTLLFWRFRLAIGFIGLALLFVFGVLDVEHFIEFAGLDVIIFLVGMMTVIGYLEEGGFFEYILEKIVNLGRGSPIKVFYALMMASFLLAALVDEVTSILFVTALVLQLTTKSKLNPVPLMMTTVFATNIGSSATVVGNPIGVMIALKSGLTFVDFLIWSLPMALLSLLLITFICSKYYSNYIQSIRLENVSEGDKSVEKNHKIHWLIFIGTLSGLVFHHQIEVLLGLPESVMLIGVALLAAGIVLLLERRRAREIIERRVDWWTLSFFLVLFASVGTLKYVGVIEVIARGFLESGFKGFGLYMFFMWSGGVMSALMDNVLAVAVLIPIIKEFQNFGLNVFPYWWAILFAGTYMGNLTPIGSTANIVAIGIVERKQHVPFKEWFKIGFLVSVPTLMLASVITYLRVLYLT
jgi:Na+/H+ antiporter NhaD/arsenite permease-like protein